MSPKHCFLGERTRDQHNMGITHVHTCQLRPCLDAFATGVKPTLVGISWPRAGPPIANFKLLQTSKERSMPTQKQLGRRPPKRLRKLPFASVPCVRGQHHGCGETSKNPKLPPTLHLPASCILRQLGHEPESNNRVRFVLTIHCHGMSPQ